MSCFVVTPYTALDAAHAVVTSSAAPDGWRIDLQGMARRLLAMNIEVYGHRYGHHGETAAECADMLASLDADLQGVQPSNDPVQRLKSLDCLIYQLSEGYPPAETMLQVLAHFRDLLEAELQAAGYGTGPADRWPAWEQSQWDRDPTRKPRPVVVRQVLLQPVPAPVQLNLFSA
jgi:hypothetical protein